jgi:hypothetical protein
MLIPCCIWLKALAKGVCQASSVETGVNLESPMKYGTQPLRQWASRLSPEEPNFSIAETKPLGLIALFTRKRSPG